MRYERLQALIRDTVVSLLGTAGLVNEIFIRAELNIGTAILCLAMVQVPAALGLISLRAHAGGQDTTPPESPTVPPLPGRPLPESSSSA